MTHSNLITLRQHSTANFICIPTILFILHFGLTADVSYHTWCYFSIIFRLKSQLTSHLDIAERCDNWHNKSLKNVFIEFWKSFVAPIAVVNNAFQKILLFWIYKGKLTVTLEYTQLISSSKKSISNRNKIRKIKPPRDYASYPDVSWDKKHLSEKPIKQQ